MSEQGTIYSSRLGPIRDDQWRAALARFDLGDFVRAEPITTGLFGQNVYLTSTRGEFVFRGCPHNPDQFPKERWFARQLHERTEVPVPWPYRVETDTALFGWSYVIMPRMPGQPAWDEGRGEADWLAIARAVGSNLGRLQELTWPFTGEYDLATDTIQPYAEGFAQRLITKVRRNLTNSIAAAPAMTEPDAPWVESLMQAAEVVYAEPFTPTFTMNDYRFGNMVVEPTAPGLWRCSGLFDLMECYFGDGESDLVRQTLDFYGKRGEHGPALIRAFSQGYRDVRPLRPRFAERILLHLLSDRLTYWEYGHTLAQWYSPDLRLRTYIERYLPCVELLQK
jgi:aminoglycoside phosphotransferase (APT) family kinase protein